MKYIIIMSVIIALGLMSACLNTQNNDETQVDAPDYTTDQIISIAKTSNPLQYPYNDAKAAGLAASGSDLISAYSSRWEIEYNGQGLWLITKTYYYNNEATVKDIGLIYEQDGIMQWLYKAASLSSKFTTAD